MQNEKNGVKFRCTTLLSGEDSRGAGGARAPLEFWGLERDKAIFLLYF